MHGDLLVAASDSPLARFEGGLNARISFVITRSAKNWPAGARELVTNDPRLADHLIPAVTLAATAISCAIDANFQCRCLVWPHEGRVGRTLFIATSQRPDCGLSTSAETVRHCVSRRPMESSPSAARCPTRRGRAEPALPDPCHTDDPPIEGA